MSGFTHESTYNESIEWYTPPELFDALGVQFDLDPCSPGAGKSFVPAKRHLTVEDDGLASPWGPEEFVFMNPPYGSQTAAWMDKLSAHGNGIALVFARTDVRWFQSLFEGDHPTLTGVLFIGGRLRFYKGNTSEQGGTPGAGSMLLAFGHEASRVLRGARDLGVYMVADGYPKKESS